MQKIINIFFVGMIFLFSQIVFVEFVLGSEIVNPAIKSDVEEVLKSDAAFLDSVTGDTGKSGRFGRVGRRGSRGVTGETGSDGPKGLKGSMGAKGKAGKKGLRGNRGETGDQGEPGNRGALGNKGPRGSVGPLGERGPAAGVIKNTSCLLGNIVSGFDKDGNLICQSPEAAIMAIPNCPSGKILTTNASGDYKCVSDKSGLGGECGEGEVLTGLSSVGSPLCVPLGDLLTGPNSNYFVSCRNDNGNNCTIKCTTGYQLVPTMVPDFSYANHVVGGCFSNNGWVQCAGLCIKVE